MLLSLVDSLRCPADHEASSLVLSVETWSGPRVSEGQLGCPVCHARYPIHGGEADFTGHPADVRRVGSEAPPDAMRLAAQLSLSEPGGMILLTGRYAASAVGLAEIANVTCLLVDAPLATSASVVNLALDDRLPLVDRALRGAAIDTQRATHGFLMESARCVRGLGRLVAPAPSRIPHGTVLIARDELEVVCEVETFTSPVQLRRVPPS